MRTKAEILTWLRKTIAEEAKVPVQRSGNDGGAFRDGWIEALGWVADELEGSEDE